MPSPVQSKFNSIKHTNMVAQTRFGPPNTASPARQKDDPKAPSSIHAWIKDFPVESISSDADEITKKLKLLGFDSLASLYHMDDSYICVLETNGFNPIHAKLIVRDSRALHETVTRLPLSHSLFPRMSSRRLKPFPP